MDRKLPYSILQLRVVRHLNGGSSPSYKSARNDGHILKTLTNIQMVPRTSQHFPPYNVTATEYAAPASYTAPLSYAVPLKYAMPVEYVGPASVAVPLSTQCH